MLRSVKNWLTLLFVVVVALDVGLAYAYVVPQLENRLINDKLRDLRGNSTLVFGTLLPALETNDKTRVDQSVRVIADNTGSRIVLINAASLAKITDSNPGALIKLQDYPMVARSIQTRVVEVGKVNSNGHQIAAAAVPVSMAPGGPIAFVVLITSSLADAQHAVQAVERQILLAGALALVLTIVAGYLASFLIARRLKRIERGAVAIAGGDLSTPVKTGLRDEIGQLAAAFNTMGERLRGAFFEIAREKENIEILLTDLAEGVIGVTHEGHIAIANPAVQQLLERPVEPDTALSDVLPDDVARAFAEMQADGEERSIIFLQASQTLEASVYPTAGGSEIDAIIVVRDVTEQARLDRARRDFIATASHELKTPLFSLSGFMELLDEGDLDAETEREFLALMRQQVDRLTDLSISLLDLSQVDAGAVHLEPGDVDVCTVTHAVASEFGPRAEARRIVIDIEGPAEEQVQCDERRLTQVLRALLDNAVKFTPDGGRVAVQIKATPESVSVSVTDDGPGIAPRDLKRVFERFFRGSGSDAQSGTGLGLSIAREIVELMGGTITVRSKLGAGATFVVQIPRTRGQESVTRPRPNLTIA